MEVEGRAGDGGKAIDDVGSKAKLKGKGERPSERAREGWGEMKVA